MMEKKLQPKKTILALMFSILLFSSLWIVVYSQPVSIGKTVQPNPFDSSPTADVQSNVAVTNPTAAYDGSLSTLAFFRYGVTGSFELNTFNTSNTQFTNIGWVDFKISYKAAASTDDRYRIVYYVGASGPVVLQDWVSGADAKFDYNGAQANRVWVNQSKPDASAWTWSDINNVRIVFETELVDTSDNKLIFVYEAWLTVYESSIPNAATTTVSVQPQAVSSIEPGSIFFVDIYVVSVTFLWGYDFTLSYNTTVLTALNYFSYNPFNLIEPATAINDTGGYVYMSLHSFFGAGPSDVNAYVTGSAPMARIYFQVDTYGKSALDLHDTTLSTIFGDAIYPIEVNGSFASVHNVAVKNVAVSANNVVQGESVTVNVTVKNDGTFTETFNVTLFYDSTAIGVQTVSSLASETNTTLTFNWDTVGVVKGSYLIKAAASVVAGETDTSDNTFIDSAIAILVVPVILPVPKSGPIGTKVRATGLNFGTQEKVTLTFDDTPIAEVNSDAQGKFTAVFNVPLSQAGSHLIKAWSNSSSANATFTVIDTTRMDINMEVGQIHFRSEIAEFYIQTAFKGEPVNVTSLTATLRKPDGTIQTLTNQHITTGLYKAAYTIPSGAPTGTYVLVIEADYVADTIESKGTKIGGFLLSPTLTGWNAMLISINGTVATIKTDVGLIKVKLDAIDAKLTGINDTIATINTNVGLIQTDIATIKTKVSEINGTVATIETDVGTILGKILAVQGDVATIKTDIGTIKTTIQGWTGGTISDIVTPTGTFNLLTLTTSTLEHLAYSEKIITVVVSGPADTTGKTNIVIPKQFLESIGTNIDQIEATLNDKKVDFTHTENPETYVLSLSYTHSTHTIKIYLTGIPPQPPLPLTAILMIIIAIVVAISALAFYMRRTRKKTVKV